MPPKFTGLGGRRRRRTTLLRSREGSRGQALVEASLILPVLLLVVMIGVDFGRLYAAQVTVADAARQAARYGAANPADAALTSACAAAGWQGSVAVAQKEAQGSPVSIACSDIAIASGGPDSYGGQYVKANVTAPFSFVTPFLTPLLSINHVTGSDTARESLGTAGLTGCTANCTTPTPAPTPTPTPGPTPTPAPCVYSGEAWAASTSGVSAVGTQGNLVAIGDTKVGDTLAVPGGGGAAPNNGSLVTVTIPGATPGDPHVLDGTVANDTANGASCAGSAHSSLATAVILPGQGVVLGTDIADITAVAANTSQTKGAAAAQTSSLAGIKINGTVIPFTGVPSPISVPGVCTIYVNTLTPGSNPPSVEVVRIVFPPGGTLATRIVGTIVIGHAQQGVS